MNILLCAYKSLNGLAPTYLSELLKTRPSKVTKVPRQLDGQDVEMGQFYNIWLALPFSSEILLLPCFINYKRHVL